MKKGIHWQQFYLPTVGAPVIPGDGSFQISIIDSNENVNLVRKKLGEKLGENEVSIVELIAKNSKISITKMADKTGLSTTAVENNINKLKEKGILKRVGPAKGGHWKIVF